MCGIFYINWIPKKEVIKEMILSLKNRGPDFNDIYIDKKENFVMGHTRLSIIDIDKRSNQPMDLHDCIITFNGEIYNYKKIKKLILEDFEFKTKSDTEVIIALYKKLGIEGFKYLEGMFAFALHDKIKKKTYFLRDPVGIKPLYFYFNSGKIVASSKIQTLKPFTDKSINFRAINDILTWGYPRVPVYDKIYEFEPGKVYDCNLNKKNIDFIVNKRKTIKHAIEEQFVNSDRPVGILLSGGIDSAYIAYVCSKISKQRIHTFTIGFTKEDPDIVAAKKLAKHIGSKHHQIIISEKGFERNLKEGIDKIGFPTDLGSVSFINAIGKEIAKTEIKVLLSGDGNDEISGGYKRYAETNGLRTKELIEWYINRITKNDYEAKKKLIGDNAYNVQMNDLEAYNNSNIILWIDFKNELLFYHLKRMDHIISEYGIELRVPYLDYSFVMNSFSKSFASKVNKRGNKLLVRDFALADGLPKEFAFGPKIPMKPKNFKTKDHIIRITKMWLDNNKIKGVIK